MIPRPSHLLLIPLLRMTTQEPTTPWHLNLDSSNLVPNRTTLTLRPHPNNTVTLKMGPPCTLTSPRSKVGWNTFCFVRCRVIRVADCSLSFLVCRGFVHVTSCSIFLSLSYTPVILAIAALSAHADPDFYEDFPLHTISVLDIYLLGYSIYIQL